jgi:hypothetical protein
MTTNDETAVYSSSRLQVALEWVNLADFPIHVRDVRAVARVGSQPEWDATKGDEFELGARTSKRTTISAEAKRPLPSVVGKGVLCDLLVEALVSGPWDGGLGQRTHALVHDSIWLPAPGLEPTGHMTEAADIDLAINHHLQTQYEVQEHMHKIFYADLDRDLRLAPGSSKARLAVLAREAGHKVEAAPSFAVVTYKDHPVSMLDGGYGGEFTPD